MSTPPFISTDADGQLPTILCVALRRSLPSTCDEMVAAIAREVPFLASVLDGPLGVGIRGGVEVALDRFLDAAERESSAVAPVDSDLDPAITLGRVEAREGRSLDTLLAAYRVGARVAWESFSRTAIEIGVPPTELVQLATLVFAFVDRFSAATTSGHIHESNLIGRRGERNREMLGTLLLVGAEQSVVAEAADRCRWKAPETLVVILVPDAMARMLCSRLDERTLLVPAEVLSTLPRPADDNLPVAALITPQYDSSHRKQLKSLLGGRWSVIGPARPTAAIASSYDRCLRATALTDFGSASMVMPFDADEHLFELVRHADAQALADLRARVLQPFTTVDEPTRARLVSTLHAWLLYHGGRTAVAEQLHVHPQTVRYRMDQVRDLLGTTLSDPTYRRDFLMAIDPHGS